MTSEQIREHDAQATALGLPDGLLMEQAGSISADRLSRWLRKIRPSGVIVVVGSGHNGADGMVLARCLAARGVRTSVYFASVAGTSPLWRKNWELLKHYNLPILNELPEDKGWLIVDAVFGVGLSRPLSAELVACVQQMNPFKFRLALDVPTGLDATTGAVLADVAFMAQRTYTFGFLKAGFFLGEASRYVGDLEVISLSYPEVGDCTFSAQWSDEFLEKQNNIYLFQERDFRRYWPVRNLSQHKGHFGRAVCLVGWGYPGAALLVLRAAQAGGCGYTHWVDSEDASSSRILADIIRKEPQVLVHAHSDLSKALQNASAVAIGSGCDAKLISKELLQTLMSSPVPVVADAGALDALMTLLQSAALPPSWVLTPHPGEAARLLGITAAAVNQDRILAAKRLSDRYGCVVVLKGHKTVVSSPKAPTVIISSGSDALAKAGSGDVLTGLLVSILAQGVESHLAAVLAAWLHGHVGDVWSETSASASLTPQEIILRIPGVLLDLLAPQASSR
jgi:hydroxyethylthiazole kinase-like uncharacterized protein yjeF